MLMGCSAGLIWRLHYVGLRKVKRNVWNGGWKIELWLLERLWIMIVGTYIRSCKPSRYPNKGLWCERFWLLFWGPSLLFQFKFKFGGFDVTERFELVENVVNVDAKGKSNGKWNGKSSLTSCVIIQVVSYVDRSC